MRLGFPPKRQGLLEWLLQRVTAALLLFAVGAHLWTVHLVKGGRFIDFETVNFRLGHPFFQFLDITLVGLVIYHGLYGLRAVIFDFVAGSRVRKTITLGMVLLSLVAFILALKTYQAFMSQ